MRFTYEGVFAAQDDGGYIVEFPEFEGCQTFGEDLLDAVEMGAGVLESFISIALAEGLELPSPVVRHIDDADAGVFSVLVSVEVDPDMDVPVRTTAEAAQMLGVSTGRVRQMISAGILTRRKEGRENLITLESIERRLSNPGHPGRPRRN